MNENNVLIFQPVRWEQVVKNVVTAARSHVYDPDIVQRIFILIHKASDEEQN